MMLPLPSRGVWKLAGLLSRVKEGMVPVRVLKMFVHSMMPQTGFCTRA